MRTAWLLAACVAGAAGGTLDELRVLCDGYPRAYFFRQAEGFAANKRIEYGQWDKCFRRLMGIEGKVLDEEVPGRAERNIEFFTRFKRQHPDQLVLLHFNGNARDPRYQADKFFAGHWVYYNGAKILADVSAEEGETNVRVADASLFRTETGRYRTANEDVGLCLLDDAGRPDWHESEQTQLVSVDVKKGVIRVKRGCYGTKPRAFPANRAYAAAHAQEGPWGRASNLLWFHNYSTRCPRDEAGRTCSDVLVDDLAARFLPGGELAAFDGLEFDVLYHSHSGRGKRALDCDADGQPDSGVFAGVNTYGIGVVQFCRKLRERLGDGKLILADGMGVNSQRAFGLLNGIESEGWPHLSDWAMRDWPGGLNRHFFWAANARPPVFNYVNHKFITRGEKPGDTKPPDVPFSTHRLVLAAAVLTDSAVCYSFPPPKTGDELIGIWDELRKGTENVVGWLGKPLGPPVRLALQRPDLLKGEGKSRLQAVQADGKQVRFRLAHVPCDGPDLVVFVTARAEPMKGYPREVARLMWVGTDDKTRFMTFANDRDFTSAFYFSDVKAMEAAVEIAVEGSEPVTISAVTAHAHPDAICREFERGAVVANPAPRPYAFDLGKLFPGKAFRRLRGSPEQDPVANNGQPVQGPLTLAPRDALFLVTQ
ncbi:MAG TPA: hypothetical protein VNE39_06465 [Planctomycetota bacterium]|nr:hypothetical protein [Planctomycetota bacterium]